MNACLMSPMLCHRNGTIRLLSHPPHQAVGVMEVNWRGFAEDLLSYNLESVNEGHHEHGKIYSEHS